MMPTAWKVINRFGAAVLLVACGPCTVLHAYVDAGGTEDLKHLRMVAERGSIRDEIVLAGDYFMGKGVKQDPKMAAYWYEKAAGHGNPAAQNQIGYFYQAGIGVPQDSERAFHWYQLAAASGFAKAKVNLAITYLYGVGTRKNGDLAVQLLKQAFEA